LVPLCFIAIFIMKHKAKGSNEVQAKIEFPWFLLGFILLSVLGSYIFGPLIPVSDQVMESISTITGWLLTAAMVGLGLNVSLRDLRTRALKPLFAMTITSVCLSVLAYFIV